tara:strand:+ start:389 stop:880 length:492 start_codon:yes stop_codon:yes gene_type:complete
MAYLRKGFKGIEYVSQWRVNAYFAGDADPIDSNWEAVDDPVTQGVIGSAMTESSGIFTFPVTGIWWVDWKTRVYGSHSTAARAYGQIWSTLNDGSAWLDSGVAENWVHDGDYSTAYCNFIFDVTSTSTHKVKFGFSQGNNSQHFAGDSGSSYNSVTFMRLGDT